MSEQPSSQRVATHDQAILTGAPVAQGEPFQVSMSTSTSQAGFANLPITVPQDKILVIQSASVRVKVPPGQQVLATLSASHPPGSIGTQYFVLARQGTFGGLDVFTGNHSMMLYGDPPGPNFNVARSSTSGLLSVEIAVVGFFAA
jgi:hypothetical protein